MDENFLETVSTVERYGNVAITACSSPFCSHCLHALSPDSVLCTHKHTSDASTTHAHAHAHCTKARPLAETPRVLLRPGWLAMLAEKKYKQKWSEDPRNSRWSEGLSLSQCYIDIPLDSVFLSRPEQVRVPDAGADGLERG